MLTNTARYYHTIKHLKLKQIIGQLTFRFTQPSVQFNFPSALRSKLRDYIAPLTKQPQPYLPDELIFLNQKKNISGKNIWSDPNIDKLWLYNLHYFDFICDSNLSPSSVTQLLKRWIEENPAAMTCGWEPYPTSLRIVNWIKLALTSQPLSFRMLHSLSIQTRFLSKRIETHLLGNHVLANAKALLFAGLFFSGREAEQWLKKGLLLFNKQIAEQILPDGAHFELSPMYHSIILEDLLDLINLFQTYARKIPENWLVLAKKMLSWLQAMCHPDGNISFFNDAALKIAPTLAELNGYQQRLNLNWQQDLLCSSYYMPESGYCRIQQNNITLIVDAGEIGPSYQPGHGHADVLSFELSYGKKRIFVNSGTSCYKESLERIKQRSSAAHNTLVINDCNSSDVWKSFRVARRAKISEANFQETSEKIIFQAAHDGYFHPYRILHKRCWQLTDSMLIIQDDVVGRGSCNLKLFFHLHPNVHTYQENEKFILLLDENLQKIAEFHSESKVELIDSFYYPEFNCAIANKTVLIHGNLTLPYSLKTTIKFIR